MCCKFNNHCKLCCYNLLGLNNKSFVRMENVGFGDCFIIHDNSDSLMVDCGSMQQSFFGNSVCCGNITGALSNKNSLLITHFHSDHYNLLSQLACLNQNVTFNKHLYIRGLVPQDLFFWKQVFFVGVLQLFLSSKDMFEFYSLIDLNKVLSHLLSSGVTIKTVKKGSTFSIGKTECKVLWPAEEALSNSKNKKIETGIKIAQETIRSIITIFPKDFYNNQDDNDQNNLIDFLKALIDDQNKQDVDEKSTLDFLQNVEKEISVVNSLNENLFSRIKKILLQNQKRILTLSDLENYLSIVFMSEKRFLFCGDATKRVMKNILKEIDSSKKIKYIKVPHHGTKNYYVDFSAIMTESSIQLIPNSFRYKNWFIYEKYTTKHNCECLNCGGIGQSCPKACTSQRNLLSFKDFSY